MNRIKVAVIGLDTSHSIAFPQLIQDPATPEKNQIHGLIVTRCLRFETPFQSKTGLDNRQKYLESIGVMVTEDFDTAVADCDAIMLEINDPSLHVQYFEKCAKLGKPIFLDKPIADTFDNAVKIMDISRKNDVRFFTSSALRFDVDFVNTLAKKANPVSAAIWGPVGKAASGSSIIWYGVHSFEMLQAIMGRGAIAVHVSEDCNGYVCHVIYADGRRGVVELSRNYGKFGGIIKDCKNEELHFRISERIPFYQMLIVEIVKFFKGESQVVALEDSFEVMAMLAAADKSASTGNTAPVYSFQRGLL